MRKIKRKFKTYNALLRFLYKKFKIDVDYFISQRCRLEEKGEEIYYGFRNPMKIIYKPNFIIREDNKIIDKSVYYLIEL